MSTRTFTPDRPATPAQPVAHLCRRYTFSASHRLHSSSFDEPTNQHVFGKCNNPHGHGHNYTVELALRGPVDPITGMVVNLADLDQFAEEHLLARFDHQNLNTLPCFARIVPTSENLTLEIFRIFRHFRGAHLVNVHVAETPNNSFEYTGAELVTETGTQAQIATPEHGTDLVTGGDSHSGVL